MRIVGVYGTVTMCAPSTHDCVQSLNAPNVQTFYCNAHSPNSMEIKCVRKINQTGGTAENVLSCEQSTKPKKYGHKLSDAQLCSIRLNLCMFV